MDFIKKVCDNYYVEIDGERGYIMQKIVKYSLKGK